MQGNFRGSETRSPRVPPLVISERFSCHSFKNPKFHEQTTKTLLLNHCDPASRSNISDNRNCAYLQSRNVGKLFAPDNLTMFAKELHEELVASGHGCVVGSGFGPKDKIYIDLCLTDVEKAIPVLRSFYQRKKMPHNSYLRFYDAVWQYEWVGMYDDTVAPNNLHELF